MDEMLSPDKIAALVQYWHSGCEEDFESARLIFEKADRYLGALFFMHLSLEKGLKALVVARIKDHAPLTHNLIFLSEKAGLSLSEDNIRLLTAFNEFNLETRYPDEKRLLKVKATKEFTKLYLAEAQRLKTWILGELKKSP